MKPINLDNINIEDIDTSILPPTAQWLISHLGFKTTLVLMEHYGGRIPYVPTKPIPDHKLEKLIGRDKFVILCNLIGGDNKFYVPKLDKILSQIKKQLAQQMASNGLSANTIAQELNISSRHAQRIKTERDHTRPPNLDLFQ